MEATVGWTCGSNGEDEEYVYMELRW